jgi:hypothetical protein
MNEADLWRGAASDPAVSLLVWGPGETGSDYAIRLAIKETLQAFFENGRVRFSEDEDITPTPDSVKWLDKLAVQERLQAARADVVYIVATSPGAKLEVILFGRYKEVAPKLHVLLPKVHEDRSFLGRVASDVVAMLESNHQVQRFDDFTKETVCAYCLSHAKSWYMRTHPEGPASLIP